MPKSPNIPLDKLRAVSETMAKIWELRIRAFESGCKSIGVDYYDIDTIKDDLLRLAKENERLKGIVANCQRTAGLNYGD